MVVIYLVGSYVLSIVLVYLSALETGLHYSAVTTTQTDTGIYLINHLHFVQMMFTSFTGLGDDSSTGVDER